MIKVILFDVDGVLVEGEMFSVHLAKEYGIKTDTTNSFFNGEFKECIIGKKDLKNVLPPYLKKWGWEKTLNEFLDYWFRSEHNINQKLINYVKRLRKKGIKCYVATNQEKYRVKYLMEQMEFATTFNDIFASCYLGYRKPEKNFWYKLFNRLKGVSKNEVLFWDNTVTHIEAAKTFGFNAEVYKGFDDFKNKMTRYLRINDT